MPDQVWNFLIPGAGAHEFRWTGNSGYVDSRLVKLSSDQTHPDLSVVVLGVTLLLKRKRGLSWSDPLKWVLCVDGRVVEETVLSATGIRDLKNMQEGSYQIATHFSPTTNPAAIYHFLVKGVAHSVSIGHDQVTGRVEIAVDNKVSLGRSYKILDSGLKLNLSVDGVDCQATVSQNVFSWSYRLVVNSKDILPSYSVKQGGRQVEPVEVCGNEDEGGDGKANTRVGGRQRSASGDPNASEDYGDTEKTASCSFDSGRSEGELSGIRWRGSGAGGIAASSDDQSAKGRVGAPQSSSEEAKGEREERRPEPKAAGGSAFESEVKSGPSAPGVWPYGGGDDLRPKSTSSSSSPPPSKSSFLSRPCSDSKSSSTSSSSSSSSSSCTSSMPYDDDYEPDLPRGVSRDVDSGGYTAGLVVGGRFLSLGTFKDVEDAAEAYREGVSRYRKK